PALREVAAPEELARTPAAHDHHLAAHRAREGREHRRHALALERPRVLACLRMVLTRDERAEESTLRDELPAAHRTLLVFERCEIVRFVNQRLVVHRAERLLE